MPQIQMPPIVRSGQATQQGIEGLQNAMLTRSRLDSNALQQQQMGMQNQEMQRQMNDRAELESLLMSTPPEQRDRVGLEFLKARDPEKAAKLQATYVQRFADKARIDPKNAAVELENATGEKIELGNRFSKLPIDGVEAYVDNFTGHIFQPNSAKEYAQIKADLMAKIEEQKQQGRKDLETLKAGLRTEKGDTSNTVYEDFRSPDPAKRALAEAYMSKQKQPSSEPGSYLPMMDPQGNIKGAWNAKTGSYKESPVDARRNALPSSEKKAASDITSAEQKILNLGKLYKPEYVGPIQGRFNMAKIKTPGVPIDKGLAEFVAQNTTLKNEIIKFITGAQMSEPEANRIMQQIPAMEDKPEFWEAKYKITLQNIEILKQKMSESGYVFGGRSTPKADSYRKRYNY